MKKTILAVLAVFALTFVFESSAKDDQQIIDKLSSFKASHAEFDWARVAACSIALTDAWPPPTEDVPSGIESISGDSIFSTGTALFPLATSRAASTVFML